LQHDGIVVHPTRRPPRVFEKIPRLVHERLDVRKDNSFLFGIDAVEQLRLDRADNLLQKLPYL
jgi:hypothetical protein